MTIRDDGSAQPFILSSKKERFAVILPLTSDRLLVGSSGSIDIPATEELNKLAAACSDRFVVSAIRNVDDLASLIGSRQTELLDTTISDAVARLRPSKQADDPLGEPVTESEKFSYSLTLPDWGTNELVQELSEVLHPIIAAIHRMTPLNQLSGIAFPVDLDSYVATLDLGYAIDDGPRFPHRLLAKQQIIAIGPNGLDGHRYW